MPADILFSVLTPTWNRANYLNRVWNGLSRQTFRKFEWIVADDGSSDETPAVISRLAASSTIRTIYIRADRHVGKSRMDNAAIKHASGQFILWCVSDDWLLPQALERLWETWNSIPTDQRASFVGLTALAGSTEVGATIPNSSSGSATIDVSWNDLAVLNRTALDMCLCVKADVLKANPFPEVDLVIPESIVWSAIGNQPARLISEILLMKEYRAAHALSFTQTMGYNRGRAYSLAATTCNLRGYTTTRTRRILNLLTFIRYCLHGEIPHSIALDLWGDNTGRLAYWLAFPLAFGLATKDRLQGKVQRTHLEFLAARDSAHLVVEILNGDS